MQLTPIEILLLEFIRKSPENMRMIERLLGQEKAAPDADTSKSGKHAANGHIAQDNGITASGTMQEGGQ